MWYRLNAWTRADEDFALLARELFESALRALILFTGGAYLVGYLLIGVTQPDEITLELIPITAALVLVYAGVYWVLQRHLVLAQILWLLGLVGLVTMALILLGEPQWVALYALLPLAGVATLGWPAGLILQGLVIALVFWIVPSLMPAVFVVPSSQPLQIVTGATGILAGALGWGMMHAWAQATKWALQRHQRSREKMEEAFEQRLEFSQTQEDLIQANQELARLSDRLRMMHQVAEEARQAKQAFVANVSHELRTPLNMVIGFSEMIPKLSQVYGVELPPPLLSDIAAIQRNSRHLSKLVDDVLDLSQAESDRMVLSKDWCSLGNIVEEAVIATQVMFDAKGLYLRTTVEGDVPPIFCDSTRIRQVILNLLSNAARFTEKGGVSLKVSRENSHVLVCVADTGPGIPVERQEDLFQPFQQLDSSIRRRYGGSGLGLSISKRFVELHEGKMWLESQVEEGTTFCFTLPISTPLPAQLDHDSALRWFNPYESSEFRQRTRRSKAPLPEVVPRFLVLEQGETLRQVLSRHLEDVELVSVPDFERAVEELNRSPARALIVNAPVGDNGLNAPEHWPELPYNTPVLRCWVPEEDHAVRQLGVARYLVKPITMETLVRTLTQIEPPVETILLVDDDPEVLRLFTRMLEMMDGDYRILQTTSGQRALNLLQERQPDVVLLDLVMPGLDGFQVLEAKHQDPTIRDIPVVIISSKDPTGEPIVSNTLCLTREGGLSSRDLAQCIWEVSEVLALSERPVRRELQESPSG
jgi:signal transduction histidine kinase/CheY-like chemotaxis protein